jgi:C4-type Zn-finger protein
VAKGRTDLLRRQVVKSNSATVTVPELQFEIPPGTQKGVITTVEGLLTDASTGLRHASAYLTSAATFTTEGRLPEHALPAAE